MIQVYDKYGKIKSSGIPGFGTVTAVSAGNLSPLFTTVVTSPTSTPNIAFTLTSQTQKLFFASPNSGSGTPTFRAIQASDLPSLSSTYVPVTRNITINGTTFDLSADRTWNVGTVTSVAALTLGTTGTDLNSSVANSTTTPVITLNVPTASATNRGVLSSADWTTFNNKQNALTNPVTGTGASGQVAFWSGTTAQSGSSDLIYNNTNKSFQLSNSTNSNPSRGFYLTQTTADGAGNLFIFQKSRGGIITSGTTISVLDNEGFDGISYQKSSRISFATSGTISTGIVPGIISFLTTNSSGILTSRTTINENGLLAHIGNFQVTSGNTLLGTTTDAGFRLDVNGTARVQNMLTLSPPANTTGLTLSGYSLTGANNQPAIDLSGTWNTTGTPTLIRANVTNTASNANSLLMDLQVGGISQFRVRRDGMLTFNGAGSTLSIYGQQNGIPNSTGNAGFAFRSSLTAAGPDFEFLNGQSNSTITSGSGIGIRLQRTFEPASGTATYTSFQINQTINQTGGANGITRGLFINTTLTAAADWRAIESTNGRWILTDTYSAGSGSLANPSLDIAATWNTTGTPTLIRANVTDTASNAASILMALQVNGNTLYRFRKDSVFSFGPSLIASIRTTLNGTFDIRSQATGTESDFILQNGALGSRNHTSGSTAVLISNIGYVPTSGNGSFAFLGYSGIINQTGGASGVTRGIFLTPTLTSAADWRSIEWSNNTGRGLWGAGTANNAMAGALNVGSATNANASAILELTSTTRGFLPPRMTTTERNAIAAPAAGLVIYNTTDNKHQGYDGTNWNNFY